MRISPECDEEWNSCKLHVEMDEDGVFYLEISCDDGPKSVKIAHHEFLAMCAMMPVLADTEIVRVGF